MAVSREAAEKELSSLINAALGCVAYVKLDKIDAVIDLFEKALHTLERNQLPTGIAAPTASLGIALPEVVQPATLADDPEILPQRLRNDPAAEAVIPPYERRQSVGHSPTISDSQRIAVATPKQTALVRLARETVPTQQPVVQPVQPPAAQSITTTAVAAASSSAVAEEDPDSRNMPTFTSQLSVSSVTSTSTAASVARPLADFPTAKTTLTDRFESPKPSSRILTPPTVANAVEAPVAVASSRVQNQVSRPQLTAHAPQQAMTIGQGQSHHVQAVSHAQGPAVSSIAASQVSIEQDASSAAVAAAAAVRSGANVAELLEALKPPTQVQHQPKVLRPREADDARPGASVGVVGSSELGLSTGVTVDYMSPKGGVRQLSPQPGGAGGSMRAQSTTEISKNGGVLAFGKQKAAAVTDASTTISPPGNAQTLQATAVSKVTTDSDGLATATSATSTAVRPSGTSSAVSAANGTSKQTDSSHSDAAHMLAMCGDLLNESEGESSQEYESGAHPSASRQSESDTFAASQTSIPGSPKLPPNATPKPDFARERLVNLVTTDSRFQQPNFDDDGNQQADGVSDSPHAGAASTLSRIAALSNSPNPNALGSFPIIGANGTPKPAFLKRLDRDDARGGELIRKRKQLTELLKRTQMYIPQLDLAAYNQIKAQLVDAVRLLESSCVQSANIPQGGFSGTLVGTSLSATTGIDVNTNESSVGTNSASYTPSGVSLDNLHQLTNINLNLGEFGLASSGM